MLVLSRRKEESIVVGEDVEIRVIEIRGNQIRLGIIAPKSIQVHRKEVFEALHNIKHSHRNKYFSCALQPV